MNYEDVDFFFFLIFLKVGGLFEEDNLVIS